MTGSVRGQVDHEARDVTLDLPGALEQGSDARILRLELQLRGESARPLVGRVQHGTHGDRLVGERGIADRGMVEQGRP